MQVWEIRKDHEDEKMGGLGLCSEGVSGSDGPGVGAGLGILNECMGRERRRAKGS